MSEFKLGKESDETMRKTRDSEKEVKLLDVGFRGDKSFVENWVLEGMNRNEWKMRNLSHEEAEVW